MTYLEDRNRPKHDPGAYPDGRYRLRCARRGWPVGWVEVGDELERRFVPEGEAVVFKCNPNAELSLWQAELGPLRFEPVGV